METVIKIIYRAIYLILEIVRILAVGIIINQPFLGWLVIFIIDTNDYFFALRTGITYAQYQLIDKSIDILNRFYFVIPAYIFNWPHRHLFLFLFFYRLIGDFLFFKFKSEKYFFVFPNLIEFLLPAYIIFNKDILLALSIALPLKLIHEYGLHVKNTIDPWSKSYIRKHPEHQRKLIS